MHNIFKIFLALIVRSNFGSAQLSKFTLLFFNVTFKNIVIDFNLNDLMVV